MYIILQYNIIQKKNNTRTTEITGVHEQINKLLCVLTLGAKLCLLELSVSSKKSTWKECPLLRMPLALEGSYLSFRGFREESYWASLGTMLMGDCLGPLATGNSSSHLSGPTITYSNNEQVYVNTTLSVLSHSLMFSV